jgi:uncharacterized protein YPO0396
VALQLLAPLDMSNDLEQFLKDVFGEPLSRLNQFQSDQMKRLQAKLQELAREAVKEELARLHTEIAELRARVVTLEEERVRAAADSIQSSF